LQELSLRADKFYKKVSSTNKEPNLTCNLTRVS
jgi:hypothetical protein